jgi:hypothetical protein
MDQPQPCGDFVAFLNRDKQSGDRRPTFEGRIAKPGTDEKARDGALGAFLRGREDRRDECRRRDRIN